MPHYHILKRDRKKTEFQSIVILRAKSVRSAFGAFRKLCRTKPKEYSIDPKMEYHIYPINHCRFWNFKRGKWKIDSFFGNHDGTKYRKIVQKRMDEYFKNNPPITSK